MSLLPDRHPQRDFFILDIADAVPKDDTASMEHPLFSLATKPDRRELKYVNAPHMLRIRPSGLGLPTIFDKDVLIFVISQLMARKNRGEEIGQTVRFSAHEMLVATNRKTGGIEYQRLEDAFSRLQGTQFITNVETGGQIENTIFSLVDQASFVRTKDERFRVDHCTVKLSDWLMRAIESNQVVTISRDYFRLRRPLERRLYEIMRKHCGNQPKWQIGLAKLKAKTGSSAPLKRFRHNLRQIIEANVTPDYWMELTAEDLVIVRPRKRKVKVAPSITLPSWAEEKGRAIALEKRLDYYTLRADWIAYAQAETAKGSPPEKAGAAFVAFCNKRDPA